MGDRKIKERRKNPRYLVRALVDYESPDTYLYDYSTDLSQGGIFIETNNPASIDSPITLRFTLPNIDRVFEIKGRVAWHNQPDPKDELRPVQRLPRGMGIEFLEMDKADREIIQKYLQESQDTKKS